LALPPDLSLSDLYSRITLPTLLWALLLYLRPLLLEEEDEGWVDFFFAAVLARRPLAEERRVPLFELLDRRLELDFFAVAIMIQPPDNIRRTEMHRRLCQPMQPR